MRCTALSLFVNVAVRSSELVRTRVSLCALEPGAGALAKFVCKRCGASLFVNVLYSHARCIYIYCLIYDGYTGDTHARCIYIYYLIYDRYTGDRTKKKQQNICSD